MHYQAAQEGDSLDYIENKINKIKVVNLHHMDNHAEIFETYLARDISESHLNS